MTKTAEIEFKNYYVESVYITANVETGVLYNRSGRRMLALTNDFLIGLHRALEKECGENVEKVLQHCGKKWGKNFGKGLDAEWSQYYEQPAKDFPIAFYQSLLAQEFGHNGWGILEVNYELMRKGIVVITLDGAIMGDIRTEKLDYSADSLTAGILAGLFTHFLGHEVDCLQTQSANSAEGPARFILTDPSRLDAIRSSANRKKSHQQIIDLLEANSS